jgi:subtilisin family serine protease
MLADLGRLVLRRVCQAQPWDKRTGRWAGRPVSRPCESAVKARYESEEERIVRRTPAFSKTGLVWIAIVVVAVGLSVVLTLLRGEGGDGAAESPLATATPAATVDVSEKIEPELLELVELEEERPGQGREQAAWNIPFDEQGRVSVFIGLDPDLVVVHPRKDLSTPVGQQEASQLILAYGAKIDDEISLANLITAHVPLDQIKALAQEEAVTDIWLDRIIVEDLEDPVVPTLPPSPEGPWSTATPAATVDVSEKIEPELLALVELEEQQPGQGREQAGWDILFDQQGRVPVLIQIDRELIVVQPSETKGEPVGRQEAAQLIMAYGAQIIHEMEIVNMIAAYIPLGQIKALAQEEAVTHIWLSRISEGSPSRVTPNPLAFREGSLQEDPNVHIRADLLRNRGYAGEGTKVAFADTGFDVEHPAFSSANTSAIDSNHTQRTEEGRGWGLDVWVSYCAVALSGGGGERRMVVGRWGRSAVAAQCLIPRGGTEGPYRRGLGGRGGCDRWAGVAVDEGGGAGDG